MTAALEASLRAFYDHWDRRDIDGLAAHFHPDAVLTDHRHMSSWGGTTRDWLAMSESWWSVLADGRVVAIRVLGASPDRNVHEVTVAGTDTVSGGPAEIVFYAASVFEDGLIARSDFFDDETSAVEHFEGLGA